MSIMKKISSFILYIFLYSLVCPQHYEPFIVPQLGNTIDQGVFTGNRLLGTMTYLYPKNRIRIDIERTDVYDHRKIYPYYLVHGEQPENISLIRKSIAHWQSKDKYLQGYSLSGAGAMYAMLKDGDQALHYLRDLNNRFIQPNTLYKESGPVIETPFALSQSLQELSLQFWNGTVHVFPAIPTTWKDVSFQNFRTDGAFLISAEKKNGITKTISVMSEHEGTIKLWVDQTMKNVTIYGPGKLISQKDNLYIANLKKGSKLILKNE